jgi:hypothetical protein
MNDAQNQSIARWRKASLFAETIAVNERQLEELVQLQRQQLFFAHCAWLDEREKSLGLRERVLYLESLLDQHGVDYTSSAAMPSEHPEFDFSTHA